MPKKKRYRFYHHDSDVLVIPTFRARIDKSKAPLRRREYDPPDDDAIDGLSKYFPKQNRTEKTYIECTLLDEEAKSYGFRKKAFPVYDDPEAREQAIQRWHTRQNRRQPFFTPLTSLGLIGPNRSSDQIPRSKVGTSRDGNKSILREHLDRNILRMTRVSMAYACKQYPSLPSRNLLDKYAFLFGLKPNITKR